MLDSAQAQTLKKRDAHIAGVVLHLKLVYNEVENCVELLLRWLVHVKQGLLLLLDIFDVLVFQFFFTFET